MSRSFLSNLLLWQQTGFEVFEVSAVVFHILHCVMNSFPFISVQPWPEACTFVTAARQPLWNTSIKITKRIKNTEKTVQQVVVCANASYKTSGCGCACTWLHSPKGSKPAWTCMRKHIWTDARDGWRVLVCCVLYYWCRELPLRPEVSQARLETFIGRCVCRIIFFPIYILHFTNPLQGLAFLLLQCIVCLIWYSSQSQGCFIMGKTNPMIMLLNK